MRRAAKRSRAFTLVEILVGMGISTLILGAAAAVFVTALGSWEQGAESYRLLQAGQTIGDLVERHLRAAVSPERASGDVSIYFWGEDLSTDDVYGHRITLMSSSASRFPRSAAMTDVSEIDFEFDPEGEDGLTMRIDSTPDEFPDDGGYRAVLSPMVKSFEVKYFDGTEWSEEWYASELPQAIEFHVMLVAEKAGAGASGDASGAGGSASSGTSAATTSASASDDPAGQYAGRTYEISRLISMPTAKRERTGLELGGEKSVESSTTQEETQ